LIDGVSAAAFQEIAEGAKANVLYPKHERAYCIKCFLQIKYYHEHFKSMVCNRASQGLGLILVKKLLENAL